MLWYGVIAADDERRAHECPVPNIFMVDVPNHEDARTHVPRDDMMGTGRPAADRRIQRTERLLHEALGALIHEKPYDAIAVKEILARANVGRTTFYSHYRDKDELLVSGMRALLHARRPAHPPSSVQRHDVLWFSRPMFEHIDERRRTAGALGVPDGAHVVHDHLRQAVAALVADELKRCRNGDDAARRVPLELLATHLAATFVLVLDSWACEADSSAAEADERYRALVQPIVEAWTAAI
jgi:AcrR family transcriptional regulator